MIDDWLADDPQTPMTGETQTLVEALAERVHKTWVEKRLREGWCYGPERNDRLKQTPMLVPYDRLPESEKEYDRATALETLRAIREMGYVLRKVR